MAATTDALLDQFQLPHPEPNVYRLGQYAPVSIRDQVVRSCHLLDRLWVTGLLADDTRLFIIGAGAAGVTAAMRAAQYGVRHVTLADSSDRVLSLQAACASRWIDPAQYDWPAQHWSGERWPIREPTGFAWPTAKNIAAPVPLKAGYADDWSADFDMVLQPYLSSVVGALQDFVRFVTGRKSAREVWRAVEPVLSQELLRRCDALWHWEELAARSAAFAPDHHSRCDRLAALHARYEHAVDEVLVDTATWPAVVAVLDGLMRGRPVKKVYLALKADHFDGCYPLNRLVALLCVAYLRREHAHNPLLTFRAMRAAAPLLSGAGWGTPIEVEFALGTTCATAAADLKRWNKSALLRQLFDGIVIRHGIDPSTLGVKSAALRLQQVPAHLP